MTVWRYEALESSGQRREGELAGSCESEVRAALRRVGLVAVDVRPARSAGAWMSLFSARTTAATEPVDGPTADRSLLVELREALAAAANRQLRSRRRPMRAQLHDSLSTLLRSGIPLMEAVDTIAGPSARRRNARTRAMLVEVREQLKGGASLAAAMREHPGWFDPVEVAIVEAGQHGGTLPEALSRLAARHEEGTKFTQKIVGALIYPAVVALAGIGVAMYLSVRTLPELAGILTDADIPVPRLTVVTIAVGQWLVHWGWLLAAVLFVAPILYIVSGVVADRRWHGSDRSAQRPELPRPWFARSAAVSDAALRLAELVRAGVPVVEALRVLAPTAPKPLGRFLKTAAERVEHGEDLASSLHDGHWFDDEFQRLVEVAEASGELDEMLERVGRRYEREARRMVERLATLLEPAVVIVLAALVGTVVMAAVLPLVRLKDIV